MKGLGGVGEDFVFYNQGEFVWKGVKYEAVEVYNFEFGDKRKTYALCCDKGDLVGLIVSQDKNGSKSCLVSGDEGYVGKKFFDLMKMDVEEYREAEVDEIARRVKGRMPPFLGCFSQG